MRAVAAGLEIALRVRSMVNEPERLYQQTIPFWPEQQTTVLSCRIVLLRGPAVQVGRFPGREPTLEQVLEELRSNRTCWAALRRRSHTPAYGEPEQIDLLVGRLLVHALYSETNGARLMLKKHGAIEFASNHRRLNVLASGRLLRHRGIYCPTGREFMALEQHGNEEGPAHFWKSGAYARQLLTALREQDGEAQNAKVAEERLSDAEKRVLATLSEYVHVEHELEEEKMRALPPLLFTSLRAEAKAHVHRYPLRLRLDPASHARLVGERPPRLKIELSEDEGVPLQIEAVLDDHQVIASVGRQVAADALPSSGRLHFEAGATNRNVRLKVIDRLSSGAHPWLTGTAAQIREAPPFASSPLAGVKATINPSQERAICAGLATPDYLLVLGPPGTGKTTVILEWIERFVAEGKRILIATQNNKAVDNVLERLTKKPHIECVRLGNEGKVMSSVQGMLLEVKAHAIQRRLIESSDQVTHMLSALDAWLDEVRRRLPELLHLRGLAIESEYALTRARAGLERAQSELLELQMRDDAVHDSLAVLERESSALQVRLREARGALRQLWRWLSYPFLALQSWRNVRSQRAAERQRVELEAELGQAAEALRQRSAALHELEQRNHELHVRAEMQLGPLPKLHELVEVPLQCLPTDASVAASALQAERARLGRIYATVQTFRETMASEGQAGLLPLLLSLVDVVGATCIGIDSKPQFREVPFDVVIIDESGQIQLHNLMVPLSRAPKAILVGDHLQLPPVVDDALQSHIEERGGSLDFLTRSWFEKLWGEAPSSRKLMLDTQFRCPAVISDFISEQFYDSAYFAGKGMREKQPLLSVAKSCLLFIDTSSHRDRYETSRNNDGRTELLDNALETELVVSVLLQAVSERPELAHEAEGLGVIVPYKNHVERIRAAVQKKVREGALPRALGSRIADLVASVDSFQGQERELIIFTLSRSNRRGEIGFLAEARRLNVAMTRAKRQLVMIGDLVTLGHAQGKAHEADFRAKMRALEDYVVRHGHPMTADEWFELSRRAPRRRRAEELEGE